MPVGGFLRKFEAPCSSLALGNQAVRDVDDLAGGFPGLAQLTDDARREPFPGRRLDAAIAIGDAPWANGPDCGRLFAGMRATAFDGIRDSRGRRAVEIIFQTVPTGCRHDAACGDIDRSILDMNRVPVILRLPFTDDQDIGSRAVHEFSKFFRRLAERVETVDLLSDKFEIVLDHVFINRALVADEFGEQLIAQHFCKIFQDDGFFFAKTAR